MKVLHFTITMLLVLVCVNLSYAQVRVSAWEIHEGNEGVIDFATPDVQARIAAFGKAKIPAKSDPKWKMAQIRDDGTVNYPDLGENVKKCAQQLDFTYFQTFIEVPDNVDLKTFTVSYDKADDGARIYIFNDKHKNGSYKEGSDLILNQSKYQAVDLKDLLTKGENRLVIVQYNQCTKNSIMGIRIKVNSKEIPPAVLPTRFRLHAYSIHGNRVEKGSNQWMGFRKNEQKVNTRSNNARYYDGFIVDPAKAEVMEFEKVDVNKEKGIIALRVVNAPIPNLYLQVADDKTVKAYPGPPTTGRAHFYVRKPEENEAGNLNYISLETAGYPANGGWFVRHQGFGLKVTPGNEGTRKDKVYRQDATWLFETVK